MRLTTFIVATALTISSNAAYAGHVFTCESHGGFTKIRGGEYQGSLWINSLTLGSRQIANVKVQTGYFNGNLSGQSGQMIIISNNASGQNLIRLEAITVYTDDDYQASGFVWIGQKRNIAPITCNFSF